MNRIVKHLLLIISFRTIWDCPIVDAEISVCSEEGNTTCAETSSRVCYNTDGVEDCGACLEGYLDFSFDQVSCRKIDDLPWREYFEYFKPIYKNATDGADDSDELLKQRLQRLYRILNFVSSWRAQIPPPNFRLGINKFSGDLLSDRAQLLGYRPLLSNSTEAQQLYNEIPRFDWQSEISTRRLQEGGEGLPDKVDWVEEGAVTPVKDQGRCGACWAISNAGAVEGAVAVTQKYLNSLSFQQMISCDSGEDTDNDGCNGGNILQAMKYSWKNQFGGLTSDAEYPFIDYDGETTEICKLEEKNLKVSMDDPKIIVTYSDRLPFEDRRDAFKTALSKVPVSMAIKSNCDLLASYAGGIMTIDDDCACENINCIDHAVLLVGYDDTTDPPSWKLKNSWGTNWGEEGYFRVAQEGGGNYGLFGMLGEGVVALKGYNTTPMVEDEEDTVDVGGTSQSYSIAESLYPKVILVAGCIAWLML